MTTLQEEREAIVEFYKELGYALVEIKSSVFREEESTLVFQTDSKNHTVDGSTILYEHAVAIYQALLSHEEKVVERVREETNEKKVKAYLVVNDGVKGVGTGGSYFVTRALAEHFAEISPLKPYKIIPCTIALTLPITDKKI